MNLNLELEGMQALELALHHILSDESTAFGTSTGSDAPCAYTDAGGSTAFDST